MNIVGNVVLNKSYRVHHSRKMLNKWNIKILVIVYDKDYFHMITGKHAVLMQKNEMTHNNL